MFNYLHLLKVVLKQRRLIARLRNEISIFKKDRDKLKIIEAENHALKSIFQEIEQQHNITWLPANTVERLSGEN
ncbi:MAG: hypothetical protein V3U84_02090 [Thiotrichaceae bacterium]